MHHTGRASGRDLHRSRPQGGRHSRHDHGGACDRASGLISHGPHSRASLRRGQRAPCADSVHLHRADGVHFLTAARLYEKCSAGGPLGRPTPCPQHTDRHRGRLPPYVRQDAQQASVYERPLSAGSLHNRGPGPCIFLDLLHKMRAEQAQTCGGGDSFGTLYRVRRQLAADFAAGRETGGRSCHGRSLGYRPCAQHPW